MTSPGPSSIPPEPPATPWASAFTRVAIAALLLLGVLYVFRSLRDLPGDAIDKGREVIADVVTVAEAFRQGTVQNTFSGYAIQVTGTTYLQFATLEQTEVWTRQDSSSIFWGTLELPVVAVSATAPVTYTYYLDFNEPWIFTLDGATLQVVAPRIRFNQPAVDASRIRYDVLDSSFLRDEDEALAALKRGLTIATRMRARQHIPLVRDQGRRQTREFVETWLKTAFGDGDAHRVEVVFADEISAALVDRILDE